MDELPDEPYYWCTAVFNPRRQTLLADDRYRYLIGQRLILMCYGHYGDPKPPPLQMPVGLHLPQPPVDPLEALYPGELKYSVTFPEGLRGLFWADILDLPKGDLVDFRPWSPGWNQEAIAHAIMLPLYIFTQPRMARDVLKSLWSSLTSTYNPWGPAHR